MNIELDPEIERYIVEKVRSGAFPDVTTATNALLAAGKLQEQWTDEDIAELRAAALVGVQQLDRGEGVPWDAEAMKQRLREHLSRSKAS
jgi:Arc/MetJ-type ribon-helix-helix transcriptional regulator